MNDLILYSQIILIIIRIIGLGVSFEFYYDIKKNKFILFIISWILWILSTLLALISIFWEDQTINQLFLILNVLFTSLGVIFYIWGIYVYFISINPRLMLIFLILFTIIAFILHFTINSLTAILFMVIGFNIVLISTYIIPPLKITQFKNYLGKSIRWYYSVLVFLLPYIIISIYTSLLGYSYGLYESNNIIMILLYYIPINFISIILIILLIHLEYGISTSEVYDLKDKYSHDLGNILQVISTASEISNNKENFQKEILEEMKDLLQHKVKEASNLIKEIRDL
ncbi:MAG: hypothetical protein ACFFCV_06400 [Promethearchaeota archaeon]